MRTTPLRRRPTLEIACGSFLISFSAVFVKLAHVGPTTSGFYRQLFGGGLLLAVALARGQAVWRGARPFAFALLAGTFFAADIFFWHRSVVYIGPGLATVMGNFQVFIMASAGVLFLKEKATWRFVAAIPLALLGLFLLVGLKWTELDSTYRTGVYFGIATAAMYAAFLLTLRWSQSAKVRLGATANLAVISLICAGLLAISIGVEKQSFRIPDTHTWAVLIAYGVVCQALGWIIISRALSLADASRAGLTLLLQPTLTFVWDIVFFGRPTSLAEATGAFMALGAIYLGNTRAVARK